MGVIGQRRRQIAANAGLHFVGRIVNGGRQRPLVGHRVYRRFNRAAATHQHQCLVALDREIAEAGGAEDLANAVLRAKGERARHRRVLAGSIERDVARDDLARYVDPRVARDRLPAGEGEPPPGLQRAVQIGEGGHSVFEEHDAEAREDQVERVVVEVVGLRVRRVKVYRHVMARVEPPRPLQH